MNRSFYSWMFFLMNPFISAILAFDNYLQPYKKNIFWAFCTFYGLTFAIGHESESSDIVRYVRETQYFYTKQPFTLNDLIVYFRDSGEIDVLRIILNYLISRFTDSQAILTTIYAFILGFFISRNIWYILKLIKHRTNNLEKLLLLLFLLVVPIWFLNGFRMWAAFHVFMYGLLPYIFERKVKSLVFIFLSALIHFSYLLPISIVLIYIALGNQIRTYFILFIISILVNEVNVNRMNQYIDKYVPTIISERSSGYRTEERVERIRQNLENSSNNWYVIWHERLLNWAMIVMLIYLFFSLKIKMYPKWRNLYSITLLFYTLSNFMYSLPSGIRYLRFSFFLSTILIVLYLNEYKNDIKFKNLVTLMTPAILLFIIVSLRLGLYTTSVTTIIGNPIVGVFFTTENLSLNDLIK